MKPAEIVILKEFIKSAYPSYKDESATSDAVWYEMLHDEDYQGAMMAVKKYIREGNKFPPTLAELIKGCEGVVLEFNNAVLQAMDKDGYFSDDGEYSDWNYENRKRKAMMWISKDYPKESVPEWFTKDYRKYEESIKEQYFLGRPAQKRIDA
ncbi:MAG: hypothetical protein EOM29_09190 [Bacteroidia bacterium]|nr:hypothetical protein [Bacteroidia bacterium]